MISTQVLPMGEEAILLELDDLAGVIALAAAIQDQVDAGEPGWSQVSDVVPAARTILLRTGTAPSQDGPPSGDVDLVALGQAAQALAAEIPEPRSAAQAAGEGAEEVVTIEVIYDGEDLADIAEATGLSEAEVVAAHTETVWSVAFFGFAPGFAYLVGNQEALQVPRRSEPRTSVPPGSVGLAGEFSAVYPRESPGGWQLLGRTEEIMWDPTADPPSRLHQGSRVRFVAKEQR
ncbi:MAG TPA: allophanate hydrolase subunit 1 [Ornithinimicrobium sp.]|uniref:5-oxoprolinase subunit B family protein n=1 Tax=Ornithinimicrobium sp. TaxID=1977084 RepID=UPI002B494DBC|nr:allophanate hydrolase subunit 1 [Ornithinimicrobium sp.]HKJ11413.1 allophanate hydrolase subunit 1 [Ornithinimicrobium sp.]